MVMMCRRLSALVEKWRLRGQLLQVRQQRPLTRAYLPIPSRGALETRIISDLSRPSRASSAGGRLPIPIICALPKAVHWDERSATSGSSHSVEAIIATFIATVTNAAGGKKLVLTRTLPHEVCGYSLILLVRFRLAAIELSPKIHPPMRRVLASFAVRLIFRPPAVRFFRLAHDAGLAAPS
jgi:hypothetical protein